MRPGARIFYTLHIVSLDKLKDKSTYTIKVAQALEHAASQVAHLLITLQGANVSIVGFVAEKGHVPVFGVRPLERVANERVHGVPLMEIFNSKILSGDSVLLSGMNGKATIKEQQGK